MAEAYRCTRVVEFVDTDMAGIAHFTAFFRWMESAETAFLRSRGMSVSGEWQGLQVSLPRVGASCDFVKPVRFGDEVNVALSVARGRITAVFCKVVPGHGLQSCEIPSAVRALLQQ